jgi:hypothetical protein
LVNPVYKKCCVVRIRSGNCLGKATYEPLCISGSRGLITVDILVFTSKFWENPRRRQSGWPTVKLGTFSIRAASIRPLHWKIRFDNIFVCKPSSPKWPLPLTFVSICIYQCVLHVSTVIFPCRCSGSAPRLSFWYYTTAVNRRSGAKAPLIFRYGIGFRCVLLHASAVLAPGKIPKYPL